MAILPSDVAKAVHVVDAHRAGELLKEALGLDPRGRKSALTPRLFLIGAMLTVQFRRHLVVAEIYRVLTSEVSRSCQVTLGVRAAPDGPALFSEKAMERLSKRLSERLEYGLGSAPDLDDTDREDRRAAVMAVVDALLAPTLPERSFSAYALDTSAIWAWGRAVRNAPKDLLAKDAAAREQGVDESELNPDAIRAGEDLIVEDDAPHDTDDSGGPVPWERDASWGVKTGKSGDRERVFGFDLHALVRVPDMDQKREFEANLIEAIDVTPAGQDIVEPSLRLIDRVIANGRPFRELLADRHYSYKLPDRWAFQLVKRGIEQVADLHKKDQGFRDYNGARLAAGWLHCPGTPDHMAAILHPGPGATKEAKEEFTEKIEARERYALRRISVRDRYRFQCPALAGKVGCPRREGTVEVAIEGDLPIVLNPPDADTAPTCCTQATVELKKDGQPKIWQKEYWGSKRWQLSNNRRTYVEGAFGNMKNASGENLGRGFFRITGLARVTLFLGVAAAAHNMRQLRNWHERTELGEAAHPLLASDSETVMIHLTPAEYTAYEDFRAWQSARRAEGELPEDQAPPRAA